MPDISLFWWMLLALIILDLIVTVPIITKAHLKTVEDQEKRTKKKMGFLEKVFLFIAALLPGIIITPFEWIQKYFK